MTQDTQALLERAAPFLGDTQRANRPNERVKGERIVGFVIGENDIGLGLSEPLFALEALVELARRSESLLRQLAMKDEALLALDGPVTFAKASGFPGIDEIEAMRVAALKEIG